MSFKINGTNGTLLEVNTAWNFLPHQNVPRDYPLHPQLRSDACTLFRPLIPKYQQPSVTLHLEKGVVTHQNRLCVCSYFRIKQGGNWS